MSSMTIANEYLINVNKCYGDGDYNAAIKCYDQAININPKYAFAFNGKGNALYNLKRYRDAVASCDQVLKIDPKHANAIKFRKIAGST